jgi:two-component system NtrC family response regulator
VFLSSDELAGAVMTTKRILFIEDDPAGRELGLFNLKKAGYRTDEAQDGAGGLKLFSSRNYDLVITDLKMPGVSGMDVLREVKKQDPQMPVIVVTAYGNMERAVEAMKLGAYDFIGKPFNRDHLLLAVEKALERSALRREVKELRIKATGVERPLIHASKVMKKLLETADRVASSEATVLITGESGTGKELVARRVHVRSGRAQGPFVAINCAAVPRELLESELFGHTKGAFTGATKERLGRFRQAHGGTMFLDEVAEIPIEMQGKLLRVLQERVVDVVGRDEPLHVDTRVIAATNKDLRLRIDESSFREDLYFRLNVVELHIPPLRERPEDLKPLVEHFVDKHSGSRELEIPKELFNELHGRPWPGNARELENICERLTILAQGDELSLDDLPPRAKGDRGTFMATRNEAHDEWPPLPPDGLSLMELERRVIERVLEMKTWNISQAARYLEVPRHILTYRMEKFGIRRPHE